MMNGTHDCDCLSGRGAGCSAWVLKTFLTCHKTSPPRLYCQSAYRKENIFPECEGFCIIPIFPVELDECEIASVIVTAMVANPRALRRIPWPASGRRPLSSCLLLFKCCSLCFTKLSSQVSNFASRSRWQLTTVCFRKNNRVEGVRDRKTLLWHTVLPWSFSGLKERWFSSHKRHSLPARTFWKLKYTEDNF